MWLKKCFWLCSVDDACCCWEECYQAKSFLEEQVFQCSVHIWERLPISSVRLVVMLSNIFKKGISFLQWLWLPGRASLSLVQENFLTYVGGGYGIHHTTPRIPANLSPCLTVLRKKVNQRSGLFWLSTSILFNQKLIFYPFSSQC